MSGPQPVPGPSVAVVPRNTGSLARDANPGLILAGPAGVVWVPLAEAFSLADRLVDAAEALEANARAAHEWTAAENAAARRMRNRAA